MDCPVKAEHLTSVDELAERQNLLSQFARKTLTSALGSRLLDESLNLARSAFRADRADLADAASLLALGVANRGQNAKKAGSARVLREEVIAAKGMATVVKSVKDKLKVNAEDAEANFVLGRYLGLKLKRRDQALPHFVKSGKATLVKAAQADLAAAKQEGVGPRMAAADAWHDLAAALKDDEKAAMQRRSLQWYTESLSSIHNFLGFSTDCRRFGMEFAPVE